MDKLKHIELDILLRNFVWYRDKICNGWAQIDVQEFYKKYGLGRHPAALGEDGFKFVKVSEYRNAISHLRRVFGDRHGCVGAREKTQWLRRAPAMVLDLESIGCKRAKPEDHANKKEIISQMRAYFREQTC